MSSFGSTNSNYSPDQESLVQELLREETDSVALANKLFGPDGIFGRIAQTEEQRRALIATPLFKLAQRRLSELKRRDVMAFAKIVEQFEKTGIGTGGLLKLERT